MFLLPMDRELYALPENIKIATDTIVSRAPANEVTNAPNTN